MIRMSILRNLPVICGHRQIGLLQNASLNDAQNQVLSKTKLQTSLAAEDSAFIYITDKKGLDYLNQIAEGVFHGESVKLDGDFYDYCNKNDLMKLPDGLYISCREIEGAAIGKSKNAKKIFDASQEVMEKIGVNSE